MAQSNLTSLVCQIEKAAHEAVEAELKASQLKEDQKPYLAELMAHLELLDAFNFLNPDVCAILESTVRVKTYRHPLNLNCVVAQLIRPQIHIPEGLFIIGG